MKILFQEPCLDKIDWDSELQGTLLLTWNTLLEELKCLYNVRIPRCYFLSSPIEIELHGFSDASNRANAAVIYMRSLYQDGRVDVRLVASKSRVAPLKKQSIPRLELLGAVLLVRLVHKFNSAGKQLKTINWTDSMTTLLDKKRRNLETVRPTSCRTTGDIARVNRTQRICRHGV